MLVKKVVAAFTCLLLIFSFSGCSTIEPRAYLPMYVDMPNEKFVIPEGYKSYTLFFATSTSYRDSLSVKEIRKLKERTKEFGRSIGKDNLIVWVGNSSNNKLNIALGKTFADRFNKWYSIKMNYTDGPYIVYVSCRPDVPPSKDDFIAYVSFAEKKPKYIAEYLDYIEAGIRREDITAMGIRTEQDWIKLRSYVENHFKDIVSLAGIVLNVISRR